EWARKTYSIGLEIHDGQSLAELLSGRDVFWIAEKYLSVPSEIYPRSSVDDGGEWYRIQLEEWKQRSSPPLSHADFSTLKGAGRHALNSEELKQDVPFWLHLIESFILSPSDEGLKRRAIYETAYLSLKSMKSLSGQEERLREYFAAIPQLEDPVDLEDASAMMNYCAVVAYEGSSSLTVEEVSSWRRTLIGTVEDKLKQQTTTNTLCLLLDLRGYLSTSIDPQNVIRPKLGEAIAWWTKLLDKVKSAPLYPLERLADRLTDFIRIFDEPDAYTEFAQRLDTLLAERSGGFVAAEKCFDRAVVLYEKGNLRGAINELHQSKVKWFAAETLQRSLKSILFISHCYSELGLQLAAKYYAMAAAYMALRSNDPNVRALSAAALATAAECDYLQGAWCGFLELTDIYLRAQAAFLNDPRNIEKYRDLQRTVLHVVIARVITERLAPEVSADFDEKIKYWGIEEWVEDLRPQIQSDWDGRRVTAIWDLLAKQLNGKPFSDVGDVREVSWSELGIGWRVTWRNDYEITIAAEQFIAILQIFLAELAEVDLCLLKTDVNIELSISTDGELAMTPLPSNEGRKWRISLPSPLADSDAERSQAQKNAFNVASSILYEVSLIPEENYSQALENCFRNGLQSKIMVVQSYATVYQTLTTKDTFDRSDRKSRQRPAPSHMVPVSENESLSWRGGPGPGYSPERAQRMLKARYSGSLPPIRLTLRKLLSDRGFRDTVQKLRSEGWLDWHILNALSNIIVNYRVLHTAEAQESEEAADKIGNEMMNTDEPEDAIPVPVTEVSEREIRQALALSMIHTLRLLRLECRQMTPDLKAIDHFLRFRYNYWSDDVEHDELFPEIAVPATGERNL
ncbi:MAG TPA: hypothetical protein VMS31_11255, partial [Pyrinomonadaceae bacterium]|nr:hypothetical protein [Pyrinomonadaceae bacterium]